MCDLVSFDMQNEYLIRETAQVLWKSTLVEAEKSELQQH